MGNFTGFQKSDDYYIHPRLGNIKRIQKEDGPQLIQLKVLVQSLDAIETWANIINSVQTSSAESALLLPKSFFYQKIGYCGGNCYVYLLFDDYMFCLKDEIKNRRAIKRTFSESSIWEILYKLIKAERLMQKFKLKVGNVKPQNILVNQQGDFRVISQYSLPNSQNNLTNDLQLNQNLYSPEQWSKYNKMLSKPKIHKLTSQKILHQKQFLEQQVTQPQSCYNQQIFSIGATMLEICTLQQSKQIYTEKGVNEQQIIKRLNSLQGKYSNSLINVLWEMLKINPQHRIKTAQVQQMLKVHQQNILNHKIFLLTTNFINPFQAKLSNTTNTHLDSSNKTCESVGKKENNFSSFFPFLRHLYKAEETVKSGISNNSRVSQFQPNIGLTKAH